QRKQHGIVTELVSWHGSGEAERRPIGGPRSSLFRRYELLPEGLTQKHFLKKFLLGLSDGRLVGVHWHPEHEGCSPTLFAFGLNASAMVVNDEVAGHEMNAVFNRTIRTNYKGIEDQAQCFFWQTWAIVSDLDLNLLLIRWSVVGVSSRYRNAAASGQAGHL